MFKEHMHHLEQLCIERGVFFAPLDLRWGVTFEQSGNGEVIDICLKEVDRSNPYFVASLGFRNGWAFPPDKPWGCGKDPLLEKTFEVGSQQFPWVKDMGDRSVTELEIMHGTLNDPDAMPRTFMYFRAVEYLKTIAFSQRPTYAEMGWAEEKLFNLKKRIIEAGYEVKWFSTAQEMGDEFQKDMTASIDLDFPLANAPTCLEREIKDHLSFVDQRTRVYVGGEDYIQELDNYLVHGGPPYVVRGPSGSGKSALVANWSKSVRTKLKEQTNLPKSLRGMRIIQRHIGATENSTYYTSLVYMMILEIKDRWKLEDAIPTPKELHDPKCFRDWLGLAARVCPVLLLIDSLDQLTGTDMNWLPHPLPRGVQCVVSVIDGVSQDKECLKRGYRPIDVKELTDNSAQTLLQTYLANYGKQLDAKQQEMVLKGQCARNPLFLCTFLQEVRTFGNFEELNEKIGDYMSSSGVVEMFLKVIKNLEKDLKNVPNLVKYVLSFIEVSSMGISEAELKHALKHAYKEDEHEGDFPTLEFSSLMIRMGESLSNQGAVKSWSHNYFRAAVHKFYLEDKNFKFRCHHILAATFEELGVDDQRRMVEELPFHIRAMCELLEVKGSQQQAKKYKTDHKFMVCRLKDCIVDPEVFQMLEAKHLLVDAHNFWVYIEKCLPDVVAAEVYADAIDTRSERHKISQEDLGELLWSVGKFLCDFGRYRNVASFFETTLGTFKEVDAPQAKISEVMLKQGQLYQLTGEVQLAIDTYVKAEAGLGDNRAQDNIRANIRSSIADCMKELGRYEEAQAVYKQALDAKITLLGKDHVSVAVSMVNMSELSLRMNEPHKAKVMFEKAKRIYTDERGEESVEVASVLTSLAACECKLNNVDLGLELYEKAKQIKENLLGKGHISLAVIQNNIATIYADKGELEKAIALLETVQESRARAYGADNIQMIGPTLNNLAMVYRKAKQLPKAMEIYQRMYQYFVEQNDMTDISLMEQSFIGLCTVYMDIGKHAKALKVAESLLKLVFTYHLLKKPQNPRLARAFGKMAMVLAAQSERIKAIYWRKRETALYSMGDDSAELAQSLMSTAVQYSSLAKDKPALELMEKAHRVRMTLFGVDHELTKEVKVWVEELKADLEDEDEDDDDDDDDEKEMDSDQESDIEKAVRQACKNDIAKPNRTRSTLTADKLKHAIASSPRSSEIPISNSSTRRASITRLKSDIVSLQMPNYLTLVGLDGLPKKDGELLDVFVIFRNVEASESAKDRDIKTKHFNNLDMPATIMKGIIVDGFIEKLEILVYQTDVGNTLLGSVENVSIDDLKTKTSIAQTFTLKKDGEAAGKLTICHGHPKVS